MLLLLKNIVRKDSLHFLKNQFLCWTICYKLGCFKIKFISKNIHILEHLKIKTIIVCSWKPMVKIFTKAKYINHIWNKKGDLFILYHWLKVKFPRKLYVSKINIYETYNAGAVVKISVKDGQNQWVDIFSVNHARIIRRARKFSPQIKVR